MKFMVKLSYKLKRDGGDGRNESRKTKQREHNIRKAQQREKAAIHRPADLEWGQLLLLALRMFIIY